jgi:hypothetical protein
MTSRVNRRLRLECRILQSRRDRGQTIQVEVGESGNVHQRRLVVSSGMIEYAQSL